MRKIVCEECRKRYDYHETEFCPRCGAYNPPAHPPVAHLEEGLLSRVRREDRGDARTEKVSFARQTQVRQPPAAPRKSSRGGVVIVIVVLWVLFTVIVPILFSALRQVGDFEGVIFTVTQAQPEPREAPWDPASSTAEINLKN